MNALSLYTKTSKETGYTWYSPDNRRWYKTIGAAQQEAKKMEQAKPSTYPQCSNSLVQPKVAKPVFQEQDEPTVAPNVSLVDMVRQMEESKVRPAYESSDFDWRIGEWPLTCILPGTNTRVFRSIAQYQETPNEREFIGYLYRTDGGQTVMIYND